MLDDVDTIGTPDPPLKKKKKHLHKISNEGVLSEDLVAQIARSVEQNIEERLQMRVQKSLTIIRFALLIIFIILAPAAWFSVKNLINISIESVNRQVYENINKANQKIAEEIDVVDQRVKHELLYLRIFNEITNVKNRTDITSDEMFSVMNNLRELSKEKNLTERSEFTAVMTDIVDVMLRFGYEDFVEELENLFPAMRYSTSINHEIFMYYGLKILSAVDVDSLKNADTIKRFDAYAARLQLNKDEVHTLPMQLLVQFHLANEERNPMADSLLSSVSSLRFNQRAMLLWTIMKYTNPLFWERNPQPADFRIAKVSTKFVEDYKSELLEISNVNGVKETLLNMYEYATSMEDIRLGRYIMYYFYKIPVD